MHDLAGFVGRLLIAGLFVAGALQKALNPSAAQALLEMRGWPVGLIWPALAFNVVASISLITGRWLEPVALALAAYCAVTSIFHFRPDDGWQMSIFVKNWAIAGGCLGLAAGGGGRWRF